MKIKRETSLILDNLVSMLSCSRYKSEERRERITITNLSFETLPTEEAEETDQIKEEYLPRPITNGAPNKYTKLGRSISLLVQKPRNRSSNRRTQSCKSKNEPEELSGLVIEQCTDTNNIRKRSKVDIGTQTRFSLNVEMIRDIDELLMNHDYNLESDDDSPDEEDVSLEEWSDSEEENEDEPSDVENVDLTSCTTDYYTEPANQNKYIIQSDVCAEPDSNIQSVLPSLQSRRGAVHTAVNISDPKDKFKIPFLSKRKNDRKWSRTELSSMLKEATQDRLHPLDGLMMSHWSELMQEETRPQINSLEYKHRDALWGLFRAELVYLIDQLKIIKDVFQGTLKIAKDNGMLSDIDESLLFPNVNRLYKVSNSFSLDLYKMFKEGNATDESVIAALQDFSKKFHHPYQRYCLNYTRAAKYLKTLQKERSDFREYEKVCQEDDRCKKRQLSDLLICPMQHLMRYVVLLQDIAKHVPENGRYELRDTIETIQESLKALESKLGTLQNFQRLQELDTILIWPKIDTVDKSIVIPDELKGVISEDQSTLCSDGRHILHAGSLVLLENPKSSEIYCFLFDDMVLLTRTNASIRKSYLQRNSNKSENTLSPGGIGVSALETSGGLYDPEQRYIVYKQPISLDEIRVHDILSSPGGCKNCFSITTYNRLKCCTGLYTFNALSPESKRLWIEKLRKASTNFQVNHPVTPINRRQRYDSSASTVLNNGDNVSLLSGRSSTGNNVQNIDPIKHKKGSQSFKGNSLLQKMPKRCRSS